MIEFKRKEGNKKLATSALQALRQIDTLAYATELEQAGANPVHKFGIAFRGTEVSVRA